MVVFEKNRRRSTIAPDVQNDRCIAFDARLFQRVVFAIEHGMNHLRLGFGIREGVFSVAQRNLNGIEFHSRHGSVIKLSADVPSQQKYPFARCEIFISLNARDSCDPTWAA